MMMMTIDFSAWRKDTTQELELLVVLCFAHIPHPTPKQTKATRSIDCPGIDRRPVLCFAWRGLLVGAHTSRLQLLAASNTTTAGTTPGLNDIHDPKQHPRAPNHRRPQQGRAVNHGVANGARDDRHRGGLLPRRRALQRRGRPQQLDLQEGAFWTWTRGGAGALLARAIIDAAASRQAGVARGLCGALHRLGL